VTARPFWDPVTGAAIAHLGLPILPALPCPTCAGRSEFRDDMFGSSPCPDCTDGVWTPPDSPVPIGVTSARPEVGAHDGYIVCSVIPKGYVPDYEADDDDFYEASGRGLMTNDEWAHKFDDISNHNPPHPIVLSSMIGEGTLRKVKVHDWDHEPEDDPGIWLEGRPGHIIGLVLQDDSLAETDISSALPFLPGLKPGDTVYLLDGFTESVECPEWHDSTPEDVINEVERRLRDEEWSSQASDRCRTALLHIDAYREGKARSQSVGRLSCPFPVDAPDHPCVQP
jgi:hypothetical protein